MKVAIIGTGGAAATNARAVQKVAGLELAGVYSSDPARARAFADRFGARAYRAVEHIAESRDLEVAIIASIPDQHKEHLTTLLDEVPIIFVEKPLGLTAQQARTMQEMAESSRSSVAVLYKHRFDQAFGAIRRILESGELGTPLGVTLSMSQQRGPAYFREHGGWRSSVKRSGGGVLLQQGIHWINFLFGLFGYEARITSVRTLEEPSRRMEDFAAVRLVHRRGFTASLVFSRATASLPTSLEILGTEASLRYDTRELQVSRSGAPRRTVHARAWDKLPFLRRGLQSVLGGLPLGIRRQSRTRLGGNDDVFRHVIPRARERPGTCFFLEDAVRDQRFIEAVMAHARTPDPDSDQG